MIVHTPRLSTFAAMLFAALVSATAALAQTAPPVAQPTPTEEPAAKPDNPGLINEIGKLFGKPIDLFPYLKPTPDTAAPAAAPSQPADAPAAAPPAVPPAVASPTPAPQAPAPQPATPAPAVAVPAPPTTGTRIPQVVTGRSSCPFAANGAPDCKTGADLLCKTKGFTGGRSLDMDSSHRCSKEALLAGARSIKDICRTETFVTRAMCQ